jgi:hypothetical protein
MGNVKAEEVREILNKIGRGELVPKLKDPSRTWADAFAGDVEFLVDGWTIVIFNDCMDWDYVDSVITPDGRTGDFEDWCGNGEQWDQPEYGMDDGIYKRMTAAFENAS